MKGIRDKFVDFEIDSFIKNDDFYEKITFIINGELINTQFDSIMQNDDFVLLANRLFQHLIRKTKIFSNFELDLYQHDDLYNLVSTIKKQNQLSWKNSIVAVVRDLLEKLWYVEGELLP